MSSSPIDAEIDDAHTHSHSAQQNHSPEQAQAQHQPNNPLQATEQQLKARAEGVSIEVCLTSYPRAKPSVHPASNVQNTEFGTRDEC